MIWALFARDGKKGSRLASKRRAFTAPDGLTWQAEVRLPSASNSMVVFLYPDAETTTRNRYVWHLTNGPEASDVQARLAPQQVLDALSDADLTRLFRRSMPVSNQIPRFEPG